MANKELRKGIADYASYSTLRMIPSVVDGFKNAQRKAFWGIRNYTNGLIKVEQASSDSKVSEFTEYLHGSMAGVIVNMAQDYVGTNNINLLQPEGNFGTRMIPESSAARYIYTYGAPLMFSMFNQADTDILEHQNFENHQIEPVFLVPTLPLILVNGATGISSGFAQKILPRDPKRIKKYILDYLQRPQKRKTYKNFLILEDSLVQLKGTNKILNKYKSMVHSRGQREQTITQFKSPSYLLDIISRVISKFSIS